MHLLMTIGLLLFVAQCALAQVDESPARNPAAPELLAPVRQYLAECERELPTIDAERRATLDKLADYIIARRAEGQPARLTFVCTHNSRRSQFAQVWSAAAASYYGLPDVRTYSGGTEATAFNPRAVAALERAGLHVERTSDESNPIYHVRFGDACPVLTAFSKRYDQAPNPRADFCAIMVCSDADRTCPSVPGAAQRVAMPCVDPKVADNTPAEQEVYDARCRQIAREMLYVMSRVAGRTPPSR